MRSIRGVIATLAVFATAVVAVPLATHDVARAANPDAMFVEGEVNNPVQPGHVTLSGPTVNGDETHVTINATAGGHKFLVMIAPKPGEVFAVGAVENTRTDTYGTNPQLAIAKDLLTQCYYSVGRYDIDEITFTSGGAIASLVMRFQQACGGTLDGIVGALTWHGTADYRDRTIAAPVVSWNGVVFGSTAPTRHITVTNHGPSVLSMGAVTLTGVGTADYSIATDGCSNATIAAMASCTVDVVFHANNMTEAATTIDALLNFVDDDANVMNNAVGERIALRATVAPMVATAFLDGERQDAATKGGYFHFTSVRVTRTGDATGATIQLANSGFVVLQPASGQMLAVGTYLHVSGTDNSRPDLGVSYLYGCTTVDGYFVIDQLERSPSGTINRLVAHWRRVCGAGGQVAFGAVNFNGTATFHEHVLSTKNMVFGSSRVGDVTARQYLTINNPNVTSLQVSNVFLTGTSPSAFRLLSNSCTNVTLQQGGTCVVTVVARPTILGKVSAVLRVIDDVSNLPGTAPGEEVGLEVIGTNDAVRFFLEGEFGDGSVGTQFLQISGAKVTGDRNSILVSGTVPNGSVSVHKWEVAFRPRKGSAFTAGVYQASTTRYGTETATRAGLDVAEDGYACTTNTGTLRIDQLAFNAAGSVSRLVARWEYHCNAHEPASFGGVDFNGTASFRRAYQTPVIRFDQVPVGTTTTPQAVVLENLGPSSLGTGSVRLVGADAGQYRIVSNDCQNRSVGAGAMCVVAVVYHPVSGVIGEHRVKLTFVDDIALSNHNGTGMDTVILGSSTVAPSSHYGDFTPLPTKRLVDTRSGFGAPKATVGPGGALSFTVGGVAGVPTTGVSAVVLNVVAMSTTTQGSWVTLFPAGHTRPATSNLSPIPGTSVQNQATIAIGAHGKVSLYNSSGRSHFIVDVVGYYSNGSGPKGARFRPIGPNRVYNAPKYLNAGSVQKFTISPAQGLPATGSVTALFRVIAPAPGVSGALTFYPDGAPRPARWSLVTNAHSTADGLVLVTLGTGRTVDVYNSSGTTLPLVVLLGYYTTRSDNGGRYVPVPATRLWDTRAAADPQTPRSRWYYSIGGRATVAHDAAAATLNVTAVAPSNDAHLTVFPDDSCPTPPDPTLFYKAGVNSGAAVVTGLSSNGTCFQGAGYIDAFNGTSYTHVVIDVFGYFTP
jgi:hypothetical protein